MKTRSIILLICCISIFLSSFSNNENEIKDGIRQIAKEIESKQNQKKKIKVAILQFRTSENSLTRFNQFVQDQLLEEYSGSKNIEVLDQTVVNRITELAQWDIEKSQSYRSYNELSEQVFRNLNAVPDAFIYGQIKDDVQTVTLTIFFVPNGLSQSSISSSITFTSSDFTNLLLGK